MLTLAFPVILTFHIYIINMDKRGMKFRGFPLFSPSGHIPLLFNTYKLPLWHDAVDVLEKNYDER